MDLNFSNSFYELQQELNEAKCNLDVLNDSIRRIVGRPRNMRILDHGALGVGCQKYGSGLKQKRSHETKSVFNRLAVPNDELKPRISSRVIRELPTREEVLEAQGSDLESRARNRRMFGSLLGTLHKFCQEESRLKQKEDKKAQIEKKLEEQQLLERETIKKEHDVLLMDRKDKQTKVNVLELKLNRLKDFATFERSVTSIRYCIRTKTKPFIYYRPYKLCKKTERLLSNTRDVLDTEMRNRKVILNNDLNQLEQELENDDSWKEDHKSDGIYGNIRYDQTIRTYGEMEFKENKSSNEPGLSSSIIVVKKN